MTESDFQFDTPHDDREFLTVLNALLQSAYENDIDIEGSWDCRNSASYPDWDITIAEVQKRPSTDRGE